MGDKRQRRIGAYEVDSQFVGLRTQYHAFERWSNTSKKKNAILKYCGINLNWR